MSTSIFVGNIAYGAMEREIRELFSAYGAVQRVHFVMDQHKGRFRGFGFVTMSEKDAVVAMGKLDGLEFQGRALKVREAQATLDESRQSA